ncbi:MAG TPA: YlxR family protein [Dehalococcoidia bacterium]|nr:YlxR family protein [Dehalococcoidia bacterium]
MPQRTCVGCGSVVPKASLIRVVRTADAGVVADPTGKKPGRGAYLCANPRCWEQALKKHRVERSLDVRLSAAETDALLSYARSLGVAGEQAR